jgi:uncharacterized protein (TIGR03118 family)
MRCFRTMVVLGLVLSAFTPTRADFLVQTNLVSDGAVPAVTIDPNLQNPWGIALSGSSPFWISDNATGVSTLYNGAGQAIPLTVTIPPSGSSSPTGTVFNGTGDFHANAFLFVSEDGTISGWRSALGTNAETLLPGSNQNVYKGVALGNNGSGNFLYAANFRNGTIDVFDGNMMPARLSGSFTDPRGLPAGFAPFNIQNLGGKLYVTYAMQDADKHDDVKGAGNGFVNVFDTNGNFLKRIATGAPGTAGNPLNSPWGLAIAPASFGAFANDLLVGNFGNGRINVFDPNSTDPNGTFLGTLARDAAGDPLSIDGLWALTFGNGGQGGDPNLLYFTAGLNGETDGLFGSLQPQAAAPVPEPGTAALLIIGSLSWLVFSHRRLPKT